MSFEKSRDQDPSKSITNEATIENPDKTVDEVQEGSVEESAPSLKE